jgi:hypothetical protein
MKHRASARGSLPIPRARFIESNDVGASAADEEIDACDIKRTDSVFGTLSRPTPHMLIRLRSWFYIKD